MSNDFFKRVPNLLSHCGSLDNQSVLTANKNSTDILGGFKFSNDGKLLMEQKVLEPYFISN